MLRSAMALERLTATCKDARIKLGSFTESDLLAPFPMLRPKGLMGLLQVRAWPHRYTACVTQGTGTLPLASPEPQAALTAPLAGAQVRLY